MWLKLNIEGMKIELQISNYQQSNKENWDDNWCNIDFSFVFQGCINYSGTSSVMLSDEVEELEKTITGFIDGKFKERKTLQLIEPDFVFEFTPNNNRVHTEKTEYLTLENEMSSTMMEWKVYLWNGGLTDHYFSITYYKDDLLVLRDYLQLVIGKLDKNSLKIKEYIDAGIIYGGCSNYG